MNEINQARICILVHLIVATVIGFISFQLANKFISIGLGITMLIITGFATEKLLKKKDIKFWLGNGLVIYIFVWLISWTYFINVFV